MTSHEPKFAATASVQMLIQRSRILQAIRQYFYDRNFIEVETPLLSQESVVDLYLEPMPVWGAEEKDPPRFLQTSPEFGMKRLLASGAPSIFQITRAFRRDEIGPQHNPEFTMLEWYHVPESRAEAKPNSGSERAGHRASDASKKDGKRWTTDVGATDGYPTDCYAAGRRDLAEFADALFLDSRFTPVPCSQRTREISFREAFMHHANIDPFSMPLPPLITRCQDLGFQLPPPLPIAGDDDQDQAFLRRDVLRRDCVNFLWSTLVESHLGIAGPEIVYDWPAAEAALAQVGEITIEPNETHAVARRFELYVRGVELANGYHELRDADVLSRRNDQSNRQRQMAGKSSLPTNTYLLAAMRAGLPECYGIALGVDRLVMVLQHRHSLDTVVAFPWDRA